MLPARSVTGPAVTPAARITWSRALFRAIVKLDQSGSVPGAAAASAIALRMAWQVTRRAQASWPMPSEVRARRTRPPSMVDLSSK
jgi:hypothetical protein